MKPRVIRILAVAFASAAAYTSADSAARSSDWPPVMVAQAAAGAGGAPGATQAGGAPSERYGSLATGMPYDYELRIGPHTRRIGVWRLQTVRFVMPDGRSFTWRFDGLNAMDEFPLAAIAPADIPVPAGVVISLNGEIPISP